MAITGSAAALAGALIYKKNRTDHALADQQKEAERQVDEARKLAAADDPLKRGAEAAARARTARQQSARALAAGSASRSRATLLPTPLGEIGGAQRKTLLGT